MTKKEVGSYKNGLKYSTGHHEGGWMPQNLKTAAIFSKLTAYLPASRDGLLCGVAYDEETRRPAGNTNTNTTSIETWNGTLGRHLLSYTELLLVSCITLQPASQPASQECSASSERFFFFFFFERERELLISGAGHGKDPDTY